jgi:hypothetical protein
LLSSNAGIIIDKSINELYPKMPCFQDIIPQVCYSPA